MTPKYPDILSAPIITDLSEESEMDMLLYLDGLEGNSNIRVAQEESARLSVYFNAMSRYLGKALDENRKDYNAAAHQNLQKLITPRSLCGIYNEMAVYMRNTLLTDVVVMTHKTREIIIPNMGFQEDYASNVTGKHKTFHFGFKQTAQNVNGNAISYTAFPLLTLDDEMVQVAMPYRGAQLLKSLQSLMTIANHDALHHMTSPYLVRSDLVHRFFTVPNDFKTWSQNIPDYEDWAQIAQQKILTQDPETMATVSRHLEDYFSALKAVGQGLARDLTGTEERKRATAAEVTEYYTCLAGHALSRIVPLDHALMKEYLKLAADACPAPEYQPLATRAEYMNATLKTNDTTRSIIAAYHRNGLDISCAAGQDTMTADNTRLFRIITTSPEDVRPHTPHIYQGDKTNPDKNCAHDLLGMVATAAKMIRFKP